MSKPDYLPYKAVFIGWFCMAEKERKVLSATAIAQCGILGSRAVFLNKDMYQNMITSSLEALLHTCGILHPATLCSNCKQKNETLDAPAVSGKVQKLLAVSCKFFSLGSWN